MIGLVDVYPVSRPVMMPSKYSVLSQPRVVFILDLQANFGGGGEGGRQSSEGLYGSRCGYSQASFSICQLVHSQSDCHEAKNSLQNI
jgi:hypothetical protein